MAWQSNLVPNALKNASVSKSQSKAALIALAGLSNKRGGTAAGVGAGVKPKLAAKNAPLLVRKKRAAPQNRLMNHAVIEYIHSEALKHWRGDEPGDVQQVVDKLNQLKCLETFDEVGYKLIIAKKYVNIKCRKPKCRFALWFDKVESGKYGLIRKVTISHCPGSHLKTEPQ